MQSAVRLNVIEEHFSNLNGVVDLLVHSKEGQEIPVPDLTDLKVALVNLKGGVEMRMCGELFLSDPYNREVQIYTNATLQDYTESAIKWYETQGFKAEELV